MAAHAIWSFNPRVSAVFYLSSPASSRATRIRAGFATGIKPPAAFELSSTDNPALKPERNRSSEVALEQTLRGGSVNLSATAFWNRYDDLIITVGRAVAGASQYRSDNLSNSRAHGLDHVVTDDRGVAPRHLDLRPCRPAPALRRPAS